MRLIVYGELRTGGKLSYYLPRTNKEIELITMSGLALYNLGGCPGVKIGTKKDKTVVEIWDMNITDIQERILLARLDMVEGVYDGLYERLEIDTPKGKAWIYTYCGNIKGLRKIKDWKKDKHKYLKGSISIIEIRDKRE